MKYITPDEARRALEQALPHSVFEKTSDGLSHFATAAEHAKAVDILRWIDLPSITPQTRFLRLHHAKADDVAIALRLIFAGPVRRGDFVAIADPRTNRIFMTGKPKNQDLAESIVALLDR